MTSFAIREKYPVAYNELCTMTRTFPVQCFLLHQSEVRLDTVPDSVPTCVNRIAALAECLDNTGYANLIELLRMLVKAGCKQDCEAWWRAFLTLTTKRPDASTFAEGLKTIGDDWFGVGGELTDATGMKADIILEVMYFASDLVRRTRDLSRYSVPAKTFNEIVILDGETVDYIAKAVEKPIMKKDETWTHTVVFPDGIEADLKCCSASYGESDGEPAWCEMVLFDHGCECGTCLDENFTGITGEWWVDYNDTRYYVEVRKGEYKITASTTKVV